MITYHELREISPQKARELIRKVLAKQDGDVSKTARILKITRPTVRWAREGVLDDRRRRPRHSPSRPVPGSETFEHFITPGTAPFQPTSSTKLLAVDTFLMNR